ncbi:hypothetical protein TNCV_1769411 [Trichonephila clavipes]|nr:hypothetical protein TNCV_1769411 [Trichonephila clavipes]
MVGNGHPKTIYTGSLLGFKCTTTPQLARDITIVSGRIISMRKVCRSLLVAGPWCPFDYIRLERPGIGKPETSVVDPTGRALFSDEPRFPRQRDCRRILILRESEAPFHPSYITKVDRLDGKGIFVWGGIMLHTPVSFRYGFFLAWTLWDVDVIGRWYDESVTISDELHPVSCLMLHPISFHRFSVGLRSGKRVDQLSKKNPEGSELTNMLANDTKMVTKVVKLDVNLFAKNDANLALPPRFRQVLIESPL